MPREKRLEHKRAEEALGKYRLFFEATRDIALFIRRRDGRIIDANMAAVGAYGYSYEELLALTIYDLRAPGTRPQVEEQMEEALTRGVLFETVHRRKDGSTFPVEVSSKGEEIGGENVLLSIIRDVTERKKAEDERERLLKELNSLLQVTDTAISTLNLDELLDRILNRLLTTMRADAATILVLEGNRLRVYATTGLEEEENQEFFLRIGEGFAGTIAKTRQPLYIEDAQVSELVARPVIKKIGIRSMLGVPMMIDSNLIGVLHTDWLSIHPKDENEEHLLTIAADRIALAIFNARLYRTTEEARKLSNALNEINATISSTLNIDEIMRRVVVDAAKAIGCETSALDTKDGDELVIRYVYKFPEEAVGARFKPEDVPFVDLHEKDRRIVVIDDAFTDPRVNPEVQRKYNVRSVMVVPLTVRDELFGVLFFNYHTRFHAFSEPEIDFATKLGLSISLAFESARLFEAEKHASQEAKNELEISSRLLEVAEILTLSIELQDVLDRLADTILEALRRSRISINLLTPEEDAVIVVASRGPVAAPPGTRFEISMLSPEFRAAIVKRRTTVLDCEAPDISERAKKIAVRANAKLSLFVPLHIANRVIGYISTDEPGERREFSQRDIRLAEGIAHQAALAIENARLYEAERNIADTLQEALLTVPEKVDHLEYGMLYHSATEAAQVGGDFYDLFELEHNRVGLVVGDVAGKGLGAAALTAVIKNTLRAYALEGYEPAEIMAKTNDVVRAMSAPSTFATVFFAIFDKSTRKLLYCNAGHPPAIIKRKSQTVELLEVYSPIIGAFPGLRYVNGETVLDTGDIMVLYTDGIIEARRDTEFFQEERLVDFIRELEPMSAREAPKAIFDEVLRFSRGRLSDDVALLALAYSGR